MIIGAESSFVSRCKSCDLSRRARIGLDTTPLRSGVRRPQRRFGRRWRARSAPRRFPTFSLPPAGARAAGEHASTARITSSDRSPSSRPSHREATRPRTMRDSRRGLLHLTLSPSPARRTPMAKRTANPRPSARMGRRVVDPPEDLGTQAAVLWGRRDTLVPIRFRRHVEKALPSAGPARAELRARASARKFSARPARRWSGSSAPPRVQKSPPPPKSPPPKPPPKSPPPRSPKSPPPTGSSTSP